MTYFNYHKTAKKLLAENKLSYFYFTENHNGIKPALVLIFNDIKHPVMPIRIERWEDYIPILPSEKLIENQT